MKYAAESNQNTVFGRGLCLSFVMYTICQSVENFTDSNRLLAAYLIDPSEPTEFCVYSKKNIKNLDVILRV